MGGVRSQVTAIILSLAATIYGATDHSGAARELVRRTSEYAGTGHAEDQGSSETTFDATYGASDRGVRTALNVEPVDGGSGQRRVVGRPEYEGGRPRRTLNDMKNGTFKKISATKRRCRRLWNWKVGL